MKKIKSYEDFCNENLTNEEINIKKAIAGAALGAGLAFGSPAKGQTVTTTPTTTTTQSETNKMTDSEKFDILRNELIKMKNEQTEIKLNLYKCHQEFQAGVGTAVFGGGLAILGSALISKDHNIGKPIAIVGGILGLAGSIMVLDSHKFIGRVGLTGIEVDFDGSPSHKKIEPGDYFLYMGPGSK